MREDHVVACMGTRTQPADRPTHTIGPLGLFALAGLVSMSGLYYLDVVAEGNVISPTTSLPIGIVAGIGALLFWFGNDPSAE